MGVNGVHQWSASMLVSKTPTGNFSASRSSPTESEMCGGDFVISAQVLCLYNTPAEVHLYDPIKDIVQ